MVQWQPVRVHVRPQEANKMLISSKYWAAVIATTLGLLWRLRAEQLGDAVLD